MILRFLFLCVAVLRAADSLADVLAAGNFSEALRITDSLLKGSPADPRLWTARGIALDGLNRPREGFSSFDAALRVKPGYLPALRAASEAAYRRRDSRAASYLQQLLALDRQSSPAHAMAGVLAFERGDCTTAIRHYEQSRTRIFADEIAAAQFGSCLLQANRLDESLRVFEEAAKAQPSSTRSAFNLAVAQLQAGRAEEAAVTIGPLAAAGDAEASNVLAAAQESTGKVEEAIGSLRRAVQLAPGDERNYLDLALLCQRHDAVPLGIQILDAGIKRLPQSARLHATRGVLQAQLGKLPEAEADFDRAGRLEPDQTYAAAGLSILFRQAGRTGEATGLLRQRLARSPNDATLQYLLADSLLRDGATAGDAALRQARQLLVRSLRSRPGFARAHVALARVCLLQNDAAGAVPALQTALGLDPQSRAALSHLVTALRKLGRAGEAAAAAEKLRLQYEQDLKTDVRRGLVRLHTGKAATAN
ncbi:MAG: tetratricopeptide repeat protein [Acidobacteria bacterium]|nr:tetratricopeptide repeat protein [Acidobacteriota bacterium]